MQQGTGALWRIRRTGGPRGDRPPEPMTVPFYALQYLALLAGMAAGLSVMAGVGTWLIRRLLQR
jgi:hypothetical protein